MRKLFLSQNDIRAVLGIGRNFYYDHLLKHPAFPPPEPWSSKQHPLRHVDKIEEFAGILAEAPRQSLDVPEEAVRDTLAGARRRTLAPKQPRK